MGPQPQRSAASHNHANSATDCDDIYVPCRVQGRVQRPVTLWLCLPVSVLTPHARGCAGGCAARPRGSLNSYSFHIFICYMCRSQRATQLSVIAVRNSVSGTVVPLFFTLTHLYTPRAGAQTRALARAHAARAASGTHSAHSLPTVARHLRAASHAQAVACGFVRNLNRAETEGSRGREGEGPRHGAVRTLSSISLTITSACGVCPAAAAAQLRPVSTSLFAPLH